MPAALFVIIAVSRAAVATVRFGHLIANDRTDDRADYGGFGLVATPSNHIAKHAACACANDCTNDTAIAVTATTIVLRRGHSRGEGSKRNTC